MKCAICGREISADAALHCVDCGKAFCADCASGAGVCDCYGGLDFYN